MDVIFDALEKGWLGAKRNQDSADLFVLWGLIGSNAVLLNSVDNYVFCDMPYFKRWLPDEDLQTSNWRFCFNSLHDQRKLDVTIERFESFGEKVQPWQTDTDHILVCPSSNTMTMMIHNCPADVWTMMTVKALKQVTNRPIRVREKPRKNGTSGPAAADRTIEQDLEGCHALVTSASLTAIDALKAGVPVFSTTPQHSPAAWCTNKDLTTINNPARFDREMLFANLAWKQFSIEEMRNGFCYDNFIRLQHNQGW